MLIKGDVNLKESSFQLIGKPQINKISFETNKEFIFKDEIFLEVSNNVQINKNCDEQKHDSVVILNLGIFTSVNLAEAPFKMNLEIEGHFMWDDLLAKDMEQLDIVLKKNAPAILYSYLRPIITLITVEANMPPLVMPLMNFCE